MELLTAYAPPPSLARVRPPERAPLRVAAVQHRWHADPDEHRSALGEGVRLAAGEGAKLVCLQELTLSPYFAIVAGGGGGGEARPLAGPHALAVLRDRGEGAEGGWRRARARPGRADVHLRRR